MKTSIFIIPFLLKKCFDYYFNQNYQNRQNQNEITNVNLVIKINDFKKFDEIFPDNLGNSKVHPYWTYLDKKGTIKINLGEDIVKFLNKKEFFDYTIDDILELKINTEYLIDINIECFKQFGEYFIYIDYNLDNKKYINFYSISDEILSTHFLYKNSKQINYILSTIDQRLIDIKPFFNNDKPITPENILLYDDNINIPLDNAVLNVYFAKKYKNKEELI